MKKMMIALCVALMGLSASADWWWTWFEERGDKDMRGCELGSFKITKEQSSSAGVRRIKAVIGNMSA